MKPMKRKTVQKTTVISARTQLGQIMQRATDKGERFLVERRGQSAVVIMSVEDYAEVMSPAPGWLDSAWKEARTSGADKLTTRKIDYEINAHRKARRRQSA